MEKYAAELEAAEKDGKDLQEIERLKDKVRILEVQSEINLPSVRWKAKNGLGMYNFVYIYPSFVEQQELSSTADMSKRVYRHLLEQRWREEGSLDLLVCAVFED